VSTLDLERQRGLGEILGTCLSLYAKHFLLFATLAFGVVLPIDLALYGVGAGQLWSGYDDTAPLAVDVAGFLAPTLVIVPLISANHARAVVALGQGTVPPIGRTLLAGVRPLPGIAFVVALYDLAVFGGLLLLVLPGLYSFVRWYVCAQAAVVDELRGESALRRSGQLVEDSWWRVFGISSIILLITLSATIASYQLLNGVAERADSGLVSLSQIVLSDVFVYSFGALSATLLYFDLRSRHA
jgi:hypothetical protein